MYQSPVHARLVAPPADWVWSNCRALTATVPALADAQVPRTQRAAPVTLQQWLDSAPSREHALLSARQRGGMTLKAIAAQLGLSLGRVSQLLAKARREAASTPEAAASQIKD